MISRLLVALGLRKSMLPPDPFGEPAPLQVATTDEFDTTYKSAWISRSF